MQTQYQGKEKMKDNTMILFWLSEMLVWISRFLQQLALWFELLLQLDELFFIDL